MEADDNEPDWENLQLGGIGESSREKIAGLLEKGNSGEELILDCQRRVQAVGGVLGELAGFREQVAAMERTAEPLGRAAKSSGSKPSFLENILQMYTMESERRIHSTVLGGEAEVGSGGDGDLDDNIELF